MAATEAELVLVFPRGGGELSRGRAWSWQRELMAPWAGVAPAVRAPWLRLCPSPPRASQTPGR